MFRPISVSDQNANNTLKRYADDDACCDGYPAACQYDITIATAATVNNIKFKRTAAGDTVTKTFTGGVSGATNVKAAIRAALVAEGYENDDDTVVDVSSTTSGSNTIYHITGSLVVVSMTHTTNTVVTPTTKCDRVGICDYYIAIAGGATNTFTVDGANASLGSLVIGSESASEVETAIEAAANYPAGYTTTVTEDSDYYYVTINGPGTIEIAWNGVRLVKQDCVAGYIA